MRLIVSLQSKPAAVFKLSKKKKLPAKEVATLSLLPTASLNAAVLKRSALSEVSVAEWALVDGYSSRERGVMASLNLLITVCFLQEDFGQSNYCRTL